MKLIEITKVQNLPLDRHTLLGYAIDSAPGQFAESYCLNIHGWVVGKQQAIHSVLAMDISGRVLGSFSLSVSRPDVAQRFPRCAHAQQSGFAGIINVLGLSAPTAQVLILAQTQDGVLPPLARIHIRRQPVQLTQTAQLQPLIINSIGRTGTTWLMRLLAEHQRISVYPEYPYEARIASYWLHSLLKIHDILPQHENPLHNTNRDWLNAQMYQNNSLAQWFKRDYQEQLAAFCQNSIDQAYLHIAQDQGKNLREAAQQSAEPCYFAEKFGPGYVLDLLWELYPGTKEIVLVRDFRDMYCSILKFAEKANGQKEFGLEAEQDEAAFINNTLERVKQLAQAWQQRADKAYLLRYEDLILQPQATLSRLFDYLGLDQSAEKIQQLLHSATAQDTDKLREHRTSSSVSSSVGRWQTELSDAQKSALNRAFAEYLKLFGYL